MLTKGVERLKSKREWDEVRDWITSRGPKEYASSFATWIDNVAENAWWLHFKISRLRETAANPRITIHDQEGEEMRKWVSFLERCGVSGLAVEDDKVRKVRFPLPNDWLDAPLLSESYRKHALDQIFLPVLEWLYKNRREDWEESKFPRFDSAEMRRRIKSQLEKL